MHKINTDAQSRPELKRKRKEASILPNELLAMVFGNSDIMHGHIFPKLLDRVSLHVIDNTLAYYSPSKIKFSNFINLINFSRSCITNYKSAMNYFAHYTTTIAAVYMKNSYFFKANINLDIHKDYLICMLLILKGLGNDKAYFESILAHYKRRVYDCIHSVQPMPLSDLALQNFKSILKVMKQEPIKSCRIDFLSHTITKPSPNNCSLIEWQNQTRAIEHMQRLTTNGFFKNKTHPVFAQIIDYALRINLFRQGIMSTAFIKLFIAFTQADLLNTCMSEMLVRFVSQIFATPAANNLRPLARDLANALVNQGLLSSQNIWNILRLFDQ